MWEMYLGVCWVDHPVPTSHSYEAGGVSQDRDPGKRFQALMSIESIVWLKVQGL